MFTMTALSSTIRHEHPDDGKPNITNIVDEELRLHRQKTGGGTMNSMTGTGRKKRRGSREEKDLSVLDDIRMEEGEYTEDAEAPQPRPHHPKKAHSVIRDKAEPVEGHMHHQSAISSRPGNDLVEDINSCCTVS
jgi:hypothetical protein